MLVLMSFSANQASVISLLFRDLCVSFFLVVANKKESRATHESEPTTSKAGKKTYPSL